MLAGCPARWSRRVPGSLLLSGLVLVVALALVQLGTSVTPANAAPISNVPYQAHVLRDQPAGYWRVGEGAGPVADDASPAAGDGTYRGATTFGRSGAIAGVTDTAVALNGTDAYVELPDLSAGETTTFSAEAWIKTSSTATGRHIVGEASTANANASWAITTNTTASSGAIAARFYVKDNAGLTHTVTGTRPINDGAWHHLAGIRNANNYYLYVDGTLDGSLSASGALGAVALNTSTIGALRQAAASSFFAGDVDEVAIYRNSLVPANVKDRYRLALPSYADDVLAASPRGYWRVGEGAGPVADDASPAAADGTYRGATTFGRSGAIAGVTDTAVALNGTDAYVELPDLSAGETTTFSAEAWIKTSSTATGRHIVGEASTANANASWALTTNTTASSGAIAARFYVKDNAGLTHTVTGTRPINDGAWHHLAGIRNANNYYLYVDGTLDGSYNAKKALGTVALNTSTIGALRQAAASSFFAGDVDEVAIYPTALPASTVHRHNAAAVAVIQDSAAPTGSLTINSGAAETTALNVTLQLAASDDYGVAEMRIGYGLDPTSSSWQPYAATSSWALPTQDGSHSLSVQYRDVGGNVSAVYTASIVLDTTCVGATITWTGASADGAWSTPGNWTGNRVPNTSDFVCVPSSMQTTVSSSVSVRRIAAKGLIDMNASITTTEEAKLWQLTWRSGSLTGPVHVPPAGLVTLPALVATRAFEGAPVTNDGTIRFGGNGSLVLGCGTVFTNSGRVEVTSAAASASIAGRDYCYYYNTYPKLRNAAGGVIDSSSAAMEVTSPYGEIENDGVVTVSAGRLGWHGRVASTPAAGFDGVSSGRFAGPGGQLVLGSVQVSTATVIDNGVVLDGTLTGTGSLAAGVTLTVDGTYAKASGSLAGPGWVVVQSGSVGGEITGNVRLAPATTWAYIGDPYVLTTIRPGALVEVPAVGLNGSTPLASLTTSSSVVNEGTVRIAGNGGLALSCGSLLTNRGRVEFASTVANASVAGGTYCYSGPYGRFHNAVGGVVDTSAVTAEVSSPYGEIENDGVVTVSAGQLGWHGRVMLSPASGLDGVSSGRFAGSGGTLMLGSAQVSTATVIDNGVVLDGTLTGTGSLAAGVTLTVNSYYAKLAGSLAGPGWVDVRYGTVSGDVTGNVRLAAATAAAYLGDRYVAQTTIRPGGVVEVPAVGISNTYPLAGINTSSNVVNEGTIRIVGNGGLKLDCGSLLTNRGRIEIASTVSNASIVGVTYCYYADYPKIYNAPGGVIDSASANGEVTSIYGDLENDGIVTVSAGRLGWHGRVAPTPVSGLDGVSSGRFAGTGGPLVLGNVKVGAATDLRNGVTLDGELSGVGSLADGVNLVVNGYYAKVAGSLAGPGWVIVQYGTVSGDVTGNVRLAAATATASLGDRYLAQTTIRPSGVVEIPAVGSSTSNYPYAGVNASTNVVNEGTIRIAGDGGLTLNCASNLTNSGRIEVTSAVTTASIMGVTYCYDGIYPKFSNAAGGLVDSAGPNGIAFTSAWENDGSIVASGGRWLLKSGANVDVIHDGSFASASPGKLFLCGLFLTTESAWVADNVGLADLCGTMVADVTGFTAQQIQDIKNSRTAAMNLAAQTTPNLEGCFFRGVDISDLHAMYPAVCNYTPQEFGADTFEFLISWMPGFSTGLDIGHAIFGKDLAGRELSTQERILDGLFAAFSIGNVDELLLDGVSRLRYRAIVRGADQACNSFSGDTPVLLADGTHRAIRDVRMSDLVVAADPATGLIAPRPVTAVIRGEGVKQLVDVTLSDGETVTATANHPFWSEDRGAFVDASSLEAGDVLREADGTTTAIAHVRRYVQRATVFNLTVANLHTFFVGDTDVLVHNINPACRSAAQRALRAALGPSPHPTGLGQAHHIYEFGRWGNDDLATTQHLKSLGFDINSADNGVWLPTKEYAGLDPAFSGSFHNGAPAAYYSTYVDSYLIAATSYQNAVARTANVKQWLLNGCMPINVSGVRRKPPAGTCPQDLVLHYRNYGIEIELAA